MTRNESVFALILNSPDIMTATSVLSLPDWRGHCDTHERLTDTTPTYTRCLLCNTVCTLTINYKPMGAKIVVFTGYGSRCYWPSQILKQQSTSVQIMAFKNLSCLSQNYIPHHSITQPSSSLYFMLQQIFSFKPTKTKIYKTQE